MQYVRKISGFQKPSVANEAAFNHAIEEVAHATHHLLEELVTQAPPHNRDIENAKAHARSVQRFGQ